LLCFKAKLNYLSVEGIGCLEASRHVMLMMTGDMLETAMAITRTVGILTRPAQTHCE
jgi:magnesium-transporting ATPase (P-type)